MIWSPCGFWLSWVVSKKYFLREQEILVELLNIWSFVFIHFDPNSGKLSWKMPGAWFKIPHHHGKVDISVTFFFNCWIYFKNLKALPVNKGMVFVFAFFFFLPHIRAQFKQCELIKYCQVVVWNVLLRFPWPQGSYLLFWSLVTSCMKVRGHCGILCTSVVCICTQDGKKSYHYQSSSHSWLGRAFEHELFLLVYSR